MKSPEEWAKDFTIYEIDNIQLVKDIQDDAREAALGDAAAIATEYEVRLATMCCKLQAFAIGEEIRQLKGKTAPPRAAKDGKSGA